MRRVALVLSIAFLMASYGRALAETVVPLAPVALKSGQIAAFWAQRSLSPEAGKPASITTVPAITGEACYMTAELGGRPVVMLLDLSSKPKLYVDTNRDGDLAKQQPFEGKLTGGQSGGGLATVILGGGGQKSFSFPFVALALKDPQVNCEVALEGASMGAGRAYATMRPASVRAGRVTLDGVERQIQVMDATFDGRYDSAFGGPAQFDWDILILDAKGDGKLATSSLTSGDVMPLPGMVQIGKGYYSLKVAADGSSATFTPVDVPMGRLDVGSKQVELDVFSDSGYHHLAKSENGWDVPAGHYGVFGIRLAETVSGAPWTLSASWPSGKLGAFVVQANATTSLPAGPPLTSELSFSGVRPMISIGYALTGRAGETYAAGAEKRGIQQPAPVFVILGEDNRKLDSGMFEYG